MPTGVSRAERREQLDVALADVEQDRLDAVLGDRLAMDERHPEGSLVERDRGVEVLDGDADVVDPAETRPLSLARRLRRGRRERDAVAAAPLDLESAASARARARRRPRRPRPAPRRSTASCRAAPRALGLQLPADPPGRAVAVGLEEQRERVAAEPERRGRRRAPASRAARPAAQHVVAGGVAARVVDRP